MEQENTGSIPFEDKEKMDPNLNNDIFNKSKITNTVNQINEFQNNQKIYRQINHNDKEIQINKSNENNMNNNREVNNYNENNNNINNINENNAYFSNEINCNVNYMSQNLHYDNNELNNFESNNVKNEKNIKVQEIMVGNRRMERYDGAEYNNPNVYKPNEAQFNNGQFIYPEQVNIRAFNNSEYNFIPNNDYNAYNAYNEHMQQNPIYNDMNKIQSQAQFNQQFQNNSPHPLNACPNQIDFSNCNNSPKNDEYINNNYNHQNNQIYQNDLKNTQISQQMNPEYFEMANREKVVEEIPQHYNQKNISVEVLYPKPGYGNSEEIQNKLKKKKKIKYIRRLKPLIEQHFDVQIIQTEEEVEIPPIYQPYLVQQNQYRNKIPIDQPYYAPYPQKGIPHIPRKYKNKIYNYNTCQKPKIPTQDFCNCYDSPSNYNSTEEMERNNIYYCTSKPSPRQTIINITPMRTINRWKTSNNSERQFKTKGYISDRHTTPSKYIDNENEYYSLERYVYSTGIPKQKYTNSFLPKNIVGKNLFHIKEKEEMRNEMDYSNFANEKKMRMRNYY